MRRTLGFTLLALATALGCAESGEFRMVGTLERDRIELIAEAREPIVEIAVREGDLVTAGQLVVRLDDRRIQAQVARAESVRRRAAVRSTRIWSPIGRNSSSVMDATSISVLPRL